MSLTSFYYSETSQNTDMCHLTMGIRSEKCVVRRFCHCANVIECITFISQLNALNYTKL